MLTTTADGLLDDRGRVFGPHERGRMTVPLGDARGGRLQGQRDNLSPLPGRDRRRPTRTRPFLQARDAMLREPATEPADLHHRVSRSLGDLDAREALSP